jgi:hypothetical protein
MQKNLHQIFPQDVYEPGGMLTTVQLTCNGNIKVKLSRTLLHIISYDPLEVEEVGAWGGDIIYATKIVNPCTNGIVYVRESINDILPFIYCCASDTVFYPPIDDTHFLIDNDDFYLIDDDNGRIYLY